MSRMPFGSLQRLPTESPKAEAAAVLADTVQFGQLVPTVPEDGRGGTCLHPEGPLVPSKEVLRPLFAPQKPSSGTWTFWVQV